MTPMPAKVPVDAATPRDPRLRAPRAAATAMLGVLALVLVVAATASVLAEVPWHGDAPACWARVADVPASADLTGVDGRWGWLPPGLTCTWTVRGGGELVQGPSADPGVLAAVALGAVALAGVRTVQLVRAHGARR